MEAKESTKIKKKTLSPMFDEKLFFNFKKKTLEELESAQITVTVFDHNALRSNAIIGLFEIDFQYIYCNCKGHEMYRNWGALTDMSGESEGVQGYIKFTIQILGPGDEPIAHDPKENA